MASLRPNVDVEKLIADYRARLPNSAGPLDTWRRRMIAWAEGLFRQEDMAAIAAACAEAADDVYSDRTGDEYILFRPMMKSAVVTHWQPRLEGECWDYSPKARAEAARMNAMRDQSVIDVITKVADVADQVGPLPPLVPRNTK